MLALLRTRRYVMLSALMVVVAFGCIAAGTWQIYRYAYKHDANRDLRDNARDPASVVTALLKVTDATGRVRTDTSKTASPQYRRATASGTYLPAAQLLVRERSIDGNIGYLVLTPLATGPSPTAPVLLVVRGFIAADQSITPTVSSAPSGTVSLTGRVQPADDAADKYGADPRGQVSSINTVSAAARMHRPVLDGYVELLAGQPGTSGLTPIPAPDLSNPAGGAVEPQHLAYIAQWYLFAMLALAAPITMARSESRRPEDAADADPFRADLSGFGPPTGAGGDGVGGNGAGGDGADGDGVATPAASSAGHGPDRPDDEQDAQARQRARMAARYGTARRM